MRIATITNWAYGATVLLTMISGATMLMASGAEERERAAVAQRATFGQLTSAIDTDVHRLTDQAREYLIDRDPSHLIVYRRLASELTAIEDRTKHLKDAGANPAELGALHEALRWTDALRNEQEAALKAAQAGDSVTAQKILFGAEYERELDRIDAMVGKFQYMLDQRTEASVNEATKASREWRRTSEFMLGMTALLFVCVLYFILRQRILHPVVRLSDVVTRLAAQDFAVEPPNISQVDEIGDMAQAIRIFRENGLERQRLEQERDADRAMRDLLSRMTQRLQGCDTTNDLVDVVGRFAPEIAPAFAGRLYIHDIRRNSMNEACDWLEPQHSRAEFPPTACWALRRGQMHRPSGNMIDIPCEHLDGHAEGNPICVPLTAQGETIGLLYFEQREGLEDDQRAIAEKYLEMLAENIGLALANLRLRDALREMALADPLTGLANRRQFDAVLTAQILEADRTGQPLSCLMIDVDHFKRFNDSFGHDAGDAVLRGVGAILNSAIREDGFAFRYGGEEFVLLMPGFTLERAAERAEQIRQRILSLKVDHRGTPLGPVTASLGVATSPDHGPAETLVRTADAALLRAKQEGRDRVVIAKIRGADVAVA